MAGYSGRAERHAVIALHDWRFYSRVLALFVLLAALWLPPLTTPRPVYDVIAVLDITGSMNVADQRVDGQPATRIDMEKRAALRLLEGLPCGSLFGLAIFVEQQPFLLFRPVEVCGNTPVLAKEIGNVDWRMGWDSESHIAATLLAAMAMARGQGAALVFMTDGQETPPLWWSRAPDFSPLRGRLHGVIAGVGGDILVPIPKFDSFGRQIGVFRPGDVPSERDGVFRGHEHLSARDEHHLQALADASGLAYLRLDSEDALLPTVKREAVARLQREPTALWGIAASLALALLLVTVVRR